MSEQQEAVQATTTTIASTAAKKRRKKRSELEMLNALDHSDEKRMRGKRAKSSVITTANPLPAVVPDGNSPTSGSVVSGITMITGTSSSRSSSPMAPRCIEDNKKDNSDEVKENEEDDLANGREEEDDDDDDDDNNDDDDDDDDDDDNIDDDNIDEELVDDESTKEDDDCKVEPENIIASKSQLFDAIEKYFTCPHCKTQNVEAKQCTVGFATTIDIECKQCSKWLTAIEPTVKDNEPTISKRRGFLDYVINYAAVLLMQQLGVSLDALELVLAHFGIAASSGNYHKWKSIQDIIGRAEQQVSKQVMEENLKKEVELAKNAARDKYVEWEKTNGATATQSDKVQQMRSFLNCVNGKVGIPISSDGAWQKRSLGKHSMNSSTGHNYAVGARSKKILNLVVYSQHCKLCYLADLAGKEPPVHRCGKNYEAEMSAKAMEGEGTVQHCIDIHSSLACEAYVHTLITDDDSTVRANTKHSYKAVAIRDYGLNFKKKNTDWPWKYDSKGEQYFLEDRGKLPLHVAPVKEWWSDVGHRVKLIGSVAFSLEGKSKKNLAAGTHLHRWECLQLKRSAGYYFKGTESLEQPFDVYCKKAKCFYLHLFNDHSLCNASWCKILQGKTPKKKYRDKEKVHSVLFKKVEEGMAPYLCTEALRQTYHKFSTQKNESLNRKSTAVAPKDRHFGSTSSLKDRLSWVVIHDSVGYRVGTTRLFSHIGITPGTILQEFNRRRDRRLFMKSVNRNLKKTKRKRAAKVLKKIKEGSKADIKATKAGMSYGSGIAMLVAGNGGTITAAASTNNALDAILETAVAGELAGEQATTTTQFDDFDDLKEAAADHQTALL